MSTTTVSGATRYQPQRTRSRAAAIHIGRFGIGSVGVLTVLIAAWGGAIPYVGPLFGYSADGAGSWHWSLAHSVLALVPGSIGLVIGFLILARTRGVVIGRGRVSLTMAGIVAVLCGSWFVIGPLAWPVISNNGAYFVAAAPLRDLVNQVGYSLGTGLILAACGAFAIGWASRHQSKAIVADRDAVAEGAPGTISPS